MSPALPFEIFPGFSAVDSLSLSCDGPIPSAHWRLAHEHDRASLKLSRPTARLGRVTLKPEAVICIMTIIIGKAAARSGEVTKGDFLTHGLSGAEVDRHYAEAFRRAAIISPALFSPHQPEAA